MAVSSSWFHQWNPPNHFPDPFFGNFTTGNKHKNEEKYGQISNLLPFFLQLGLLEPPAPPTERTGHFTTWYKWKMLDFVYPSDEDRIAAIASEDFIPENNLPLGLEVYQDRIFVTTPKWKPGVPATLSVIPKTRREVSPKLVPYPNWEYHRTDSCEGLTSVFRIHADSCGRLWVLDSGQIDVTIKPRQVCPVQIFLFDLKTDKLLLRYPLPDDFIKQDCLYSNIAIDIRDNDCLDVHAYLTDVWRYGLVVFSLKRMTSWRITDHLFYPEPLAAAYNVHGLEFEWVDGIFGMALSPYNKKVKDRVLYFHPMSSFREFFVKTSIICNETGWSDVKDAFKVMGQSRGKFGHASASGMDRNGIMFFNMVTRDAIGCWDSRKPYKRDNIGIIARSTKTLVFPNDLKIDLEKKQSVWVLSNRLPFFLYRELNKSDYNFRIMTAYAEDAIKDTVCDPHYHTHDTFRSFPDGEDCY
ncbi:protein yellow-like [Tribolium madens]|uniref:protein yellow-like n=1 Tax=Tribolium madens TaxID=41895 RepID=UPI001CF72A55|nr:protein yellow-like [Tribolium madens]XP_044253767.1 protein yellow-like [Tribolium madens]